MDINDIIYSLTRYKKEEFNSEIIKNTTKYFLKQDIKTIYEIVDNNYLITGIKTHLYYNNYYYYLEYSKPKYLVCHKKIVLDGKLSKNLLNQIDALNTKSLNLCMKTNEPIKNIELYLIISKNKLNEYTETTHDIVDLLLGTNSIKVLGFQNMSMYCELIDKPVLNKMIRKLIEVNDEIKKMSISQKERILFIKDIVNVSIGSKKNKNDRLDALVIIKHKSDKHSFQKLEKLINITYITTDTKDEEYEKYMNIWYLLKLPKELGIDSLLEILLDSRYHYYFMGLKCMDPYINFLDSRNISSYTGLVDTLLLKKINDLDYFKKYCIKTLSIDNNSNAVVINDTNGKDKFFDDTINYLKQEYNITASKPWLEKNIKKCIDLSDQEASIYGAKYRHIDKLMKEQIRIHRLIVNHAIKKYGKGAHNLFDFGFGKLSNKDLYTDIGIKEFYGVEPSLESVNRALEDIKKYPDNINYNLIRSVGDIPINVNKKFDIITFTFSIHYMIPNIDIVIDNLNNLSKKGTYITISCIDGKKVLRKLLEDGNISVRNGLGDIIWGVYKYNEELSENSTKKVLFYMKDVYGLENGSEESLVDIDKLIKKMKKNGYEVVERENFNDIAKQELKKYQREILSYHELLVLQKSV